MPHWRKFSTTENSNGYISLLLLYTGCTGCKRNICAPNFIKTSHIYISSEASSIQHVCLKDGDKDGYKTNSWNSAEILHGSVYVSALKKKQLYPWGHKNPRETTSELTGPETSRCQWSPPLEFILGEEMRLSTNTKTIRLQIQSWQWIFYITKCWTVEWPQECNPELNYTNSSTHKQKMYNWSRGN